MAEPDDDMKARIEQHAKTFEGLMSLIPANIYYSKDNSEQWNQKKTSKEEKRAARKAKLDPANIKTANDVMQEREHAASLKRKHEQDDVGESLGDIDAPSMEKPREGLRQAKKPKVATADPSATAISAQDDQQTASKTRSEKRKEKKQLKKEKIQKKKDKAERRKLRKQDEEKATDESEQQASLEKAPKSNELSEPGDVDIADEVSDVEQIQIDAMPGEADQDSISSSSPMRDSMESPDNGLQSTSSVSSIIPPSMATSAKVGPQGLQKALDNPSTSDVKASEPNTDTSSPTSESKKIKLPAIDQSVLRARLKARIDEMRAARKADGIDGKPARSRAELLEARRQKEVERKKRKKDLRRQAKLQEDANLAGTASPLKSPAEGLEGFLSPKPATDAKNEHLSFSNVIIGDQRWDGGSHLATGRKKGPTDTKTALKVSRAKDRRLDGFETEKKADIEEKDRWLNARKHVHGEKADDSTALLKKALKQKEKSKAKSEREWQAREEGVRKAQEQRQKRREDNLQKRKDEKGMTKKERKKVQAAARQKRKNRPGFEGSFRAKR